MKIATTIGEMYDFASSPANAIELYKDSGFRYLDYSFYSVLSKPNDPFMSPAWRDVIYESKETAEKLGFQFVQAHAPACTILSENRETELAAAIRSIEACGILGIKNMVIHSGFFTEFNYPADELAYFKANEPYFRALIPAMEANGVHILFENTTIKHCRGGCYFPILAKDLNAFIAFMKHPLFGAAWDVGHAHMDGIDHYNEIMELGKNLKAIHVHDNEANRDSHSAPFSGTLDFDSLMKGLISSGFDGFFTLEATDFFKFKRSPALAGPLANTPLDVKKASLSFLYTISKSILMAYGIYEE